MTIFSNNPIRVHMTIDDVWNMCHAKGIDSCVYESDQKDEFFIKFACSDINPFFPQEEKHKEDIEKEITKLKVVQDRIREFQPHRLFNSDKSIVKESILDTKIFSKENRYDVLLDRAKEVHRLRSGHLFGIIESG